MAKYTLKCHMSKKSLVSFFVLAALIATFFAIWANRYQISDYIVLRGYTQPSEIVQLATDTTMNDTGRHLFYVKKPRVLDRTSFGDNCKTTEQTIVEGCYNGINIYIFKVDDPKLNGVEQVTAAHEMLHAAYDRLSSADRKRIDGLTEATLKRLNDSRLNSLVDSYRKQEPDSIPNELHSILGTEVRDVGPELEAYYSRYFNNRSKIVNFASQYQKVFEDLNAKVEAYDADLALRKSEIDRQQAELGTKASQLNAQKAEMDSLIASGQIGAYNNQVSGYNSAVNSYNAEVSETQKLIEQYNAIVQARNNLNVQQQNLAKSIDSRPSAISN